MGWQQLDSLLDICNRVTLQSERSIATDCGQIIETGAAREDRTMFDPNATATADAWVLDCATAIP